MPNQESSGTFHYTLAGIGLVALAWLGFVFLIIAGFVMIAFAAPVAGVYVVGLIGYAGVVSEAHAYAKRRARFVPVPEPLRVVRPKLSRRSSGPTATA